MSKFTYTVAGLGVAALLALIINPFEMAKVKSGEAGLLINQYGDAETRGTRNAEVVNGRVWYNGYTHDVVKFPTTIQEYQFTNLSDQYSPEAQAITFSLKGSPVTEEIGIYVGWQTGTLAEYYDVYRKSQAEFIGGPLYTQLRGCYNAVVEEMGLTPSTYQESRTTVADRALSCLNTKFLTEDGESNLVAITDVVLLDQPTYTGAIQESIDEEFAARQRARKAQSDQQEAEAKAAADLARAQGQAAVQIEEARARAEAAKLEASVITQQYLELKELEVRLAEAEKWNGQRVPGTIIQTPNVQAAGAATN